jgi:hypothetical protein
MVSERSSDHQAQRYTFSKFINTTEQNRTEQNRTEQNRTEQNRTEQNRTEQNRTERTERNFYFPGRAINDILWKEAQRAARQH